MINSARCFKASETLLGIETWFMGFACLCYWLWCFKASETLLGIETTPAAQPTKETPQDFKASETLLGIETRLEAVGTFVLLRFKASETLLGIET